MRRTERGWPGMPRGAFLVGAAVGSGLVALAAGRAGADLIVVLSAGILRTRGQSSAAAMLPVGDVNLSVCTLARTDVASALARTDGRAPPILVGLAATEPRAALSRRLDGLAAGPEAGIANFPSAVHLSGEVRADLEAAGAGFAAELDMLGEAKARGLRTFAYVKTLEEAEAAARVAPDLVCLNFGWNAGGRLSTVVSDLSMTEAGLRARRITRRLARIAPAARVVIEGGPVVNPVQVAEICGVAGAAGYVGGSTLDRLPIEEAVYERTLAFRTAGALRGQRRRPPRGVARRARDAGIVGASPAISGALDRLGGLAAAGGPIVVSGPPGTQRHQAARAVLPPGAGALVTEELSAVEIGRRLFGGGGCTGLIERQDGNALFVETVEGLGARWQRKVARYLERGEIVPVGGGRPARPHTRLVLLAGAPLAELARQGRLDGMLLAALERREVVMPGLAERVHDLPEIVEMLRAAVSARFAFSAPALGAILRTPWPGGVTELRGAIDALAARGAGGELSLTDVEPFLAAAEAAPDPAPADVAAAERVWILDLLRRNGYARGRTAAAMGISRRTLYNRMRRHGL